jgi:signal transduction histidine kinase
MVWNVRNSPPRENEASDETRLTQVQLAGMLDLEPDQVRLSAKNVARGDMFVFRVRDAEAIARDAERLHNQAERAARARQRIEMRRGEVHDEADPEIHSRLEVHVDPEFDEDEFEARIEAQVEEAMREWEAYAEEFSAFGEELAAAGAEGEARSPPTPPSPPDVVVRVPRTVDVPPVAPVPPVPPVPSVPVFAPAPPGVALISGFEVGAQLPDGRWLVMSQGRNWAEIGWIGRAMLIIGGTLTILSILAILFARRLTRPIRNFSDAVQAVGVDPQNEPVHEEGPSELRGAARAVNTMQARIRALIADRTKTLAAVAHDMRTPLMRLRLQAENAPPEQREKMAKEIEEVEALVAGFIAFARDDPAEEARVRLDLSALLQSITDDRVEARRDVTFEGEDRVIITGQSLGLKRLFANLTDNALKYGSTARIKLRRDEAGVVVDVEDNGPGIPVAQREAVFEPFVRLSNGETGAGLGLAAARSIARAHGGDIAILDRENGALLRVTLPG